MPVLSKRIVLDCFYLLIFYFEKFSTDVCRLPCAVNVNLNLSNIVLVDRRLPVGVDWTSGWDTDQDLSKLIIPWDQG